MRKIVSFIVLLICFTYLVGCSGTGIELEPQAETPSQPLVYESVTEYGHIQINGKASAEITDGVLKVSCDPEETLTDVTVDGRRIWLTDREYSLGNSDKNTVIQIQTKPKPKQATSQEVASVVLTYYGAGKNSYAVTWHTSKRDCPSMGIRKQGQDLEKKITGYCDDANFDYVNRAVAYDLDADCEYVYTLYNMDGQPCYSASFNTASYDSDSVTLMHISDTQDELYSGTVWAELMENALQKTDNIDMILHTGDIVQHGGTESEWAQMLKNVEPYVTTIPLTLASGNHSYWPDYKGNASRIEYNHITMDFPVADYANGLYYSYDYGVYYSYDYADVHITVLSSGDSDTVGVSLPQREWLKKDLASTGKKWKIVLIHNPVYSCGRYGSVSPENQIAQIQQQTLGTIFNEYNVDLVLQGHDHVFGLTYPMDENRTPLVCETQKQVQNDQQVLYYINPEAPVYLMSGAGGSQSRSVSEQYTKEWYQYASSVSSNTAGYSLITVTSDRLTATYYTYDYVQNLQTSSYSWGIIKE